MMMKAFALAWASSLLLFLTSSASSAAAAAAASLVVDVAPDHPRPYVLPRFKGRAVKLTTSGQVIRFSITANSSGGAFSLVQHNGKAAGWTSARPHAHRLVHEHFYCSKGRSELWAKKNVSGAVDEARAAGAGDYGSVPPGTIHTFQLVDPDSQLTHIFHPGGFERLFDVFSLGDFDSAHGAPFQLVGEDPQPFGPLTPEGDEQLRSLDLYAAGEDVYVPRRDLVNGTAGAPGLNWHDGSNALPDDPTDPYFVARDYGPKFLNSEGGGYKVIQPLLTPKQATHGNFSIGTITMSARFDDGSAPSAAAELPHHFALQMDEGQLALSLEGYETAYLLQGDVAFVPAGVRFEYRATVPYTKFLYMSAGAWGLDHQLLERSVPWDFAAYPA